MKLDTSEVTALPTLASLKFSGLDKKLFLPSTEYDMNLPIILLNNPSVFLKKKVMKILDESSHQHLKMSKVYFYSIFTSQVFKTTYSPFQSLPLPKTVGPKMIG